MDSDLPRRLDQLCDSTGVTFFNLKLPCAFCNFDLSLQELADFHTKNLCVLYRDGKPFGACRPCLKLSALHEYENYCRCSVQAEILPDILGLPITGISMRCKICYKLLDAGEKIDLCAGSETVYLVRNLWRGYCRDCRKK